MLAQGRSSSAKRGQLGADVSSGLIFLKKKKRLSLQDGPKYKQIHSEEKHIMELSLLTQRRERACQVFCNWTARAKRGPSNQTHG